MVPLRVLMLLGGGMVAVFGSEAIELGGAGPLAVVAAAFVSCYFWQKDGWEVDDVSTARSRFSMVQNGKTPRVERVASDQTPLTIASVAHIPY